MAEEHGALEDLSVRRKQEATLPGGDQLGALQAEHRHVAEPADHGVFMDGPVGVAGVFDQPQAAPPAQLDDRCHVARVAVDVHHHDGASPRRDGRLDGVGIDVAGVRLDVHQDRRRIDDEERHHRGQECERGRDHLVTWLQAEPEVRGVQRRRAGAACQCVVRADVGGEGRLERRNLALPPVVGDLAALEQRGDRPHVGRRDRRPHEIGRLSHGGWSAEQGQSLGHHRLILGALIAPRPAEISFRLSINAAPGGAGRVGREPMSDG